MPNLNIKVDFQEELQRIREEVKQIANDSVTERTQFATTALARVTPIDTGYARSRWTYSYKKDEQGNVIGLINNDADYIGILNTGWSKQAPRFFIEKTLAAIGELDGPV
jgi:flagellin-like hook-associated protein FlgL